MCHFILPHVNVVTGFFCFYLPWYQTPGRGTQVVDGLKYIDKRSIFQIIATVQLLGAKRYYTKMFMHTETHTYDVSLASEFQKHLSTTARKHGVIDQGK